MKTVNHGAQCLIHNYFQIFGYWGYNDEKMAGYRWKQLDGSPLRMFPGYGIA